MKSIIKISRYNKAFGFWFLAFCFLYNSYNTWADGFDNLPIVEKRRVLSKNYVVSQKDRLVISNQYGQVFIHIWNKNEVKIDINIIGKAENDAKAQAYLSSVNIVDVRNEGLISFRTDIVQERNSWWSNWSSWSTNNDKQHGVEINYDVSLPRYMPLSIENRYGRTEVPEFVAPLNVLSSYGTFVADEISGCIKDIRMRYGTAIIKQIADCKLNSSYSTVEIDKAENLFLDNSHGSIKLGEVEVFDADMRYSNGKIGKISQAANIDVQYGGIDFQDVENTTKTIKITSSYSAVKMPVCQDNQFDFEVESNYSDFSFPRSKTLLVTDPDKTENKKPVFKKVYKGKVGKGTKNTQIVIRTNYGGFKFIDH